MVVVDRSRAEVPAADRAQATRLCAGDRTSPPLNARRLPPPLSMPLARAERTVDQRRQERIGVDTGSGPLRSPRSHVTRPFTPVSSAHPSQRPALQRQTPLVPRRARRRLALPPELEQDLLHAAEVAPARHRPRERLGLRIGQADEVAHALPGRALAELGLERSEERRLVLPLRDGAAGEEKGWLAGASSSAGERGAGQKRSKGDALVLLDRLLLALVVLLVEAVNVLLGLADALLARLLALCVARGNLVLLARAPGRDGVRLGRGRPATGGRRARGEGSRRLGRRRPGRVGRRAVLEVGCDWYRLVDGARGDR